MKVIGTSEQTDCETPPSSPRSTPADIAPFLASVFGLATIARIVEEPSAKALIESYTARGADQSLEFFQGMRDVLEMALRANWLQDQLSKQKNKERQSRKGKKKT